jgi:putative PIN family toxin of toxin-antitoxin system
MRIVLDSNAFLVSLPRKSIFRPIFDAVLKEKATLLVSNEITMEYEEILCQHTTPEIAKNVMKLLVVKPNVEKIDPFYNWDLIQNNKDDNKFVNTAVAGNADYLVTNDHHFDILAKINFPLVRSIKTEDFLLILKHLI